MELRVTIDDAAWERFSSHICNVDGGAPEDIIEGSIATALAGDFNAQHLASTRMMLLVGRVQVAKAGGDQSVERVTTSPG